MEPQTKISLRCPSCYHIGVFMPFLWSKDKVVSDLELLAAPSTKGPYRTPPPVATSFILGQRCCPNEKCQSHIFFIWDVQKRKVMAFPSERLDFDGTDIPKPIAAALEEAITCHANCCFVAAGIMVRKTLELLCADRNAEGGNLKERIKSLGSVVVLPVELLKGIDDLRLLGNDAAHVESTVYTSIDQEEIEIAIAISKEVLKAVYQYANLVSKLSSRKKPS